MFQRYLKEFSHCWFFCFWPFFFKEYTRRLWMVLRVFQGNFRGVSSDFQGWPRKFQLPCKQALIWFKESVKDVLRVFLGSSIGVSRVFPRCFKEEYVQSVSKKFHVACHSSQLHKQIEGLFCANCHVHLAFGERKKNYKNLDICPN